MGPFGQVPQRHRSYQGAPTSRRPLACSLPRPAVPPDVGVVEISQLSGKPVACVPCPMTPVESALCRCCLPPSLTASASTTFFTELNLTARNAHCLRFGPGVAPSTARLASSCTFGLGWAGFVPAGFQLEVSAHGSILLNQTWLAHQEDQKVGWAPSRLVARVAMPISRNGSR